MLQDLPPPMNGGRVTVPHRYFGADVAAVGEAAGIPYIAKEPCPIVLHEGEGALSAKSDFGTITAHGRRVLLPRAFD